MTSLEHDIRVITDYVEGARGGSAATLPSRSVFFAASVKGWMCHLWGRKTCWAQRCTARASEMDLGAQSAVLLLYLLLFLLDPACPCQGRWADRFRGTCGHCLCSEDVPGFCSMNLDI